jgi:hypothetical protein
MHRWSPTPHIRVVEAWKIVMNERRTMQKLNCDRRGICKAGIIAAARFGDGKGQSRTNPRPAGKYSMMDSLCEQGRPIFRRSSGNGCEQCAFDTYASVQRDLH